jgi:hypothetical protein
MKTGIELIAEERQRQIDVEGWTSEHDDKHEAKELVWAAMCYGLYDGVHWEGVPPPFWPWDSGWWKPSKDAIRNLTKAGALVAAQLDVELRKQQREPTNSTK